jgi:phosphoglycolate phosphatase
MNSRAGNAGGSPSLQCRAPLHVFWDWNGTLFDDAWLCRDVMNTMLRARGMEEMSEQRYQEIFDFPVRDYYGRIGFDFEKESFEHLGMEFIRGYELRRGEASLYADTRGVLERLRDAGIRQSILSAYQHDTLVSLIGEHGLSGFFHALHGHDDHYAHGKVPQGRRALENLGIDPAQTLLIGDTAHDADVARELGMDCWIIPGGNQPLSRLEETGCPILPSRRAALERLCSPVQFNQ